MFKLVKALGRLVAKLYVREGKLKVSEAKACTQLATKAEELSAKSLTEANKLHGKSAELTEEAARIAVQAQAIGKFFE